MPAGLTHLPAVTMNGLTYAPGTGNDMLIIPVFDGRCTFSVGNLSQPGVFRRWVNWPDTKGE